MDITNVLEGNVMPIGGYYGPIASYTSEKWGYTSKDFLYDEYFQIIADSGLNLITTVDCDYADDPENFLKTMDLCEKHGIRIFVKDRALETIEGEEALIERMKAYSHYKCFAGIRVIDEPESTTFPENTDTPNRALSFYTKVAAKLNAIDGLLGYVNLFPYYQYMEKSINKTMDDYQKYIDEYSDGVPTLKMLSYDHYVFDFPDPFYDVYFQNISVIRDLAKKRGIPFWAFIQAGGQWFRAKMPSLPYFPTEGQFVWNVNTCLAMGAKGIQYYPLLEPHWCSLDENGNIDPKRQGLIGADGSITPWFYMAQKTNAQIRAVDEYLMNAEHIGVLAVGDTVAQHLSKVTCKLPGNSYRELSGVTADQGALIGCFDYSGKTALYVVNYDMESDQKITLTFDKVRNIKTVNAAGAEKMTGDACELTLSKGAATLVIVA